MTWQNGCNMTSPDTQCVVYLPKFRGFSCRVNIPYELSVWESEN